MWGKAINYVASQAQAAGCEVFTDATGNLTRAGPRRWVGRNPPGCADPMSTRFLMAGIMTELPAWLLPWSFCGPPKRTAFSSLPLELIVFAEEEGTTFGFGMIGSRAWVGEIDEERLESLRNSQGKNYFEAGKPHGVEMQSIAEHRIRPNRSDIWDLSRSTSNKAPAMWRNDQRLGGRPRDRGAEAISRCEFAARPIMPGRHR